MTSSSGSTANSPETAGVLAPPPLIALASMAAGWGLGKLTPVRVVPDEAAWPLGALFLAAALLLFLPAATAFFRARTPLPTRRPTTAIVTSGPYRISRNPIYLSFACTQIGLGFATNNAWMLAMTAVTVAVITSGVIVREERYLERRFGEEYLSYKRRVRRWV